MKQFSEETRRRMSEAQKRRCSDPEWRKAKSELYKKKLPITDEQIADLYQKGMTQDEIAKMLGVRQKMIWKRLRSLGVKCRRSSKRNQYKENNSSWRGGVTHTPRGYVMVKSPQHPRAMKCGEYVMEHILVMERHLGRSLKWFGAGHKENEIVHHINGDKKDNRIENLMLTTHSEHNAIHNFLRKSYLMLA